MQKWCRLFQLYSAINSYWDQVCAQQSRDLPKELHHFQLLSVTTSTICLHRQIYICPSRNCNVLTLLPAGYDECAYYALVVHYARQHALCSGVAAMRSIQHVTEVSDCGDLLQAHRHHMLVIPSSAFPALVYLQSDFNQLLIQRNGC